jgi:hypothetical protein
VAKGVDRTAPNVEDIVAIYRLFWPGTLKATLMNIELELRAHILIIIHP